MADHGSLTFLTLNVLYRLESRYPRIIDMIAQCNATIVGLQEVTSVFHAILVASPAIQALYDVCFQLPVGSNNDTALLVKKEYSARFFQQPLFPRYHADGPPAVRNATCATLSIAGQMLACATVHIESKFFNAEVTEIKCHQLYNVSQSLASTGAGHVLIMGDCNLTGDHLLQMENKGIQDAGLIDMWLSLHPTDEVHHSETLSHISRLPSLVYTRYILNLHIFLVFYRVSDDGQDQTSADWKDNHCTWDSARNPLVSYQGEFHRPDRVLLGPTLAPGSITRECGVPPYSDHYGLSGFVYLRPVPVASQQGDSA